MVVKHCQAFQISVALQRPQSTQTTNTHTIQNQTDHKVTHLTPRRGNQNKEKAAVA